MNYQICKRCGKMYKKDGRIYCEDCFQISEKEYGLIMEYIRMNPGATVLDIIMGTGVSIKSIDNLVEEGYVSYVQNADKDVDKNTLIKVIDKIVDKKGTFYIRKTK